MNEADSKEFMPEWKLFSWTLGTSNFEHQYWQTSLNYEEAALSMMMMMIRDAWYYQPRDIIGR